MTKIYSQSPNIACLGFPVSLFTGLKAAGSYGIIDNLTLNYNNTNHLKFIDDTAPTVTLSTSYDFKNYTTGTGTEYTYNDNGGLTKDMNKGISEVSYNMLNLPQKVDIKSPVAEARNEYGYLATGQKLKVVQKWNSSYSTTPVIGSAVNTSALNNTKTTDYIGNKIYENSSLKRILTENGYYEGGMYYFYVKNHLGSNVMAVNKAGTIGQHNHYYPFGLTMGNSTNQGTQPYKYTGKELDMEHGLNLYDFEARTYDPAIGRFTSVDPMAEKYYNVSPYAYCLNNPVRFVDPTGMWIVGTNGKAATYDSKNGWSANASKDIIRIGNAMMLTPVGKEVLKTMIGTEYGISINMDPGVSSHNPERLGGAEIFTNTTSGKIAKVDITLYEGKIKEHLDYYQKMGNTHGAEGNTEKAQLLLKQQPTLTERIGQIAVHEGEHATNPDAQDKIVGKEKAEAQAVKKEIQAIKQTSVFNRSLPLFKFERINE